jgi:type I restriction enzyme M protein
MRKFTDTSVGRIGYCWLTDVVMPSSDPACGSGGMFVQSVRFLDEHGGRRGELSVFGQEAVASTWRLAKMNVAIRHIEADLGDSAGDSFHEDNTPTYGLTL